MFTDVVSSAHTLASKPIVNNHHHYTPQHIKDLIRQKNRARKQFQRTLNPLHKTEANRLQAIVKKELIIHPQNTWNTKYTSLNTQDNSLWHTQKCFRKKRSTIPNLNYSSGIASNDDQKANLIANTFEDNYTENKRPEKFSTNIDSDVTNTLENFLSTPPHTSIPPTDPVEICSYIKRLKNSKAPVHTWITMDETATRSDVASTKVGDMFTTDPFCFDAVRANSKLEKCSTCAECEDLCDALEDILDALHKPDKNTPERLRRSSVSIKIKSATAASKTAKSRKNKRATGSPTPGKGGKKKCSERSLPPNTPSPPVESETLSMEEDISSDDSSEETQTTKVVSPVGASRSGITDNGNAPSNKDYDSDSFTEVTRKDALPSIDAGKIQPGCWNS
ncbi:hypothetical protein TNCV_2322671 [Trichonephila clavipes]|nr:hypothetical protein TNCV_2322671 [Trichonephila clavipes]